MRINSGQIRLSAGCSTIRNTYLGRNTEKYQVGVLGVKSGY